MSLSKSMTEMFLQVLQQYMHCDAIATVLHNEQTMVLPSLLIIIYS